MVAAPIAFAIGCEDDPARVTLKPVNGECGRPMGARNIRVTAYARSGERARALTTMENVALTDLPSDTEQLGVEVEIGGGAVGAQGKTAPLDFLALEQGSEIPIFMAPPGGYCPTLSTMSEPRVAPLVARAGNGVLVAGGHDGAGVPLATADFYDPSTGTFTPVTLPDVLVSDSEGLVGATLSTMPDGRVALSGGADARLAVFDPVTREFGSPLFIDPRAFHAAIAIGDEQLFVAGGCSTVVGGACAGVQRVSTFTYSVDDTSELAQGPILSAGRIGATLFDVGVQVDGTHAYVMAGGTPRAMAGGEHADRFALSEGQDAVPGELIEGARAQVAQLDGGAILTAFALDGAPADGSAAVIAPGASTARVIAPSFARTGVRLIGLEDGTVVGIGGDASGEVVQYNPTTDRWTSNVPVGSPPSLDLESTTPGPGLIAAPVLTRLADGSVLVLGGTIDGIPSAGAWIYRPSLIGPTSGSLTVVPAGTSAVLTPADPATVSRGEAWELTAGEVAAHAIVGGPRMTEGTITATVRIREGGAGLLAQQMGPGRALVGEIVPGQSARVVRLDGQARSIVCSGDEIAAREPEAPATIRLEVTSGVIRLTLDGVVVASCALDLAERGAWGVAALAGSRVAVDNVAVVR